MKLPNERLITKSELIIVKQTVHECIWTLLINWQNKRQPLRQINIIIRNGISIDDKVRIPEYIRAMWYWGNSYIL